MKTFLNGLCTYLTFAALYSYSNAGLLDLFFRPNMRPPQQVLNVNNNPSRIPLSQAIQNLASTRDKYNARNQNWGTPSFHTENTQHTSNNIVDIGNSDSSENSDDENRIARNINHISPTNTALNINEQRVGNQLSGFPFVNDNSGVNDPLVNRFPENNARLNPRINSLNPLINRPSNTGNVGNIHKIIHDINKINNIMDQIKQQNANNHGNIDTNIKTNGNLNFDNTSTGSLHYPMVNVNNGLQGVHTNLHNSNRYPATGNTINNAQPPRNPETNFNTVGNNVNIVTPPPGVLMTNLPKENVNEKPSADISLNIDDKFILKPITKRKFYTQVRPVIPDYQKPQNNETLYYID